MIGGIAPGILGASMDTGAYSPEELRALADQLEQANARDPGTDWVPGSDPHDPWPYPADPAAGVVKYGRVVAKSRRHVPSVRVISIAVSCLVLLILLVARVAESSPSWPASVAQVQSEVTEACKNPDVRSEPGQVNFACNTPQMLWVFAYAGSGDRPSFNDPKTGRAGLEPIVPSAGSEVAWSLNLHAPYNPYSPVDSIQVAARAINNIIGGATVTTAHGKPIVQPGLEGVPANCLRYTGSSALTSRAHYPPVCKYPVVHPSLLVGDVWQRWVAGSTPAQVRAIMVLYINAENPGSAKAQSVIRNLPQPGV